MILNFNNTVGAALNLIWPNFEKLKSGSIVQFGRVITTQSTK